MRVEGARTRRPLPTIAPPEPVEYRAREMTTDSLFPAGTEAILPILPLRNSVLFPASVVPVR